MLRDKLDEYIYRRERDWSIKVKNEEEEEEEDWKMKEKERGIYEISKGVPSRRPYRRTYNDLCRL